VLHRCPVNSCCHSADFHASRACLKPFCDAELHESPTNRLVADATLPRAIVVTTERYYFYSIKNASWSGNCFCVNINYFGGDWKHRVMYLFRKLHCWGGWFLACIMGTDLREAFSVLEPINALKTLQINDSVICHWAKWQAEKWRHLNVRKECGVVIYFATIKPVLLLSHQRMDRQWMHETEWTHLVTGGLTASLRSVLIVQSTNMTARGWVVTTLMPFFRSSAVHLDIIKVSFIFTNGCTVHLLRSTLKFTLKFTLSLAKINSMLPEDSC
jgi:hypothetical protein